MNEYTLRITDIDWTEGNVYELDIGVKYIVRESNLFRVSGLARKTTGCYLNEEYDLASIAKLTFKRVVDWSKVPVDTKVMVATGEGNQHYKRHFAKFLEGKIYCFDKGQTSWTGDYNNLIPWAYVELAEGEEE